MTLYYFLGTLLPELKLGEEPEIGRDDFLSLLKENLTERDGAKVASFLRFIDMENIRQLWAGRPFVQKGNLDANELQEALLVEVGLPDYILGFLDQFEGTADRLKHYSALVSAFFREEIPKQTGFLKEWLVEERNRSLVLTALRSKKMGRPILEELQYENPDDPLVADILSQKDAEVYMPPSEYGDIAGLYAENQDDPLKLHKALLEYRFRKAGEASLQPFTMDRIIAYLVQLGLVEKSLKLGAA